MENTLVEYWKQFKLKQILEENRYQNYIEEYKNCEVSSEPNRSKLLSVKVRNQKMFLDAIRKQEQDLTNKLLGFAVTLKDDETYIFARCIIKNEETKNVARMIKREVEYVDNIKRKLNKQLNECIVSVDDY